MPGANNVICDLTFIKLDLNRTFRTLSYNILYSLHIYVAYIIHIRYIILLYDNGVHPKTTQIFPTLPPDSQRFPKQFD